MGSAIRLDLLGASPLGSTPEPSPLYEYLVIMACDRRYAVVLLVPRSAQCDSQHGFGIANLGVIGLSESLNPCLEGTKPIRTRSLSNLDFLWEYYLTMDAILLYLGFCHI